MAATAKGAARHEAIADAAADLVAAHGPDAVSHRAVATAAGVPLAATTYYFRDLGELLSVAVQRAGARELDEVGALVQALPRAHRSIRETAALLVDVLLGPRRRTDSQVQAYYERYLAAGRHPVLRPVLQADRARLEGLVQDVLDRGDHRTVPLDRLIALVDGTVLSALVEGDGNARGAAELALTDLLSRRRRW